jgi:PKD repeat protein
VAAVLSSALVITPQLAPEAMAADPPVCTPEQESQSNPNCVRQGNVPDGEERPEDPTLSPPQPLTAPAGWVQQSFVAGGPVIGGTCPGGGVPYSRLPCTYTGVGVSVQVFGAGGTPSSLSEHGIYLGSGPDPSAYEQCRTTHTCPMVLRYNPATVTGTVVLLGYVSSTVLGDLNGDGNILDSVGYGFSMTINGQAQPEPPVASFTASADPGNPGGFVFSATSTDPQGEPMSHEWDFGDGGSASGAFTTHRYTAPGTYTVRLTSRNQSGRTDTEEQQLTVAAPRLGLSIELLDGAAPPLEPGAPVRVEVTVSASADGVGELRGIRFDGGALVSSSPEDLFEVIEGPTPELPSGGFSLAPGEERSFVARLRPEGVGRYTLSSAVRGTDAEGDEVSATAEAPGEVGQALEVTLVADPPYADQPEGPDGPEPVDVTVTITLRNTTAEEMTGVRLTSLRVDRTKPGQLLAVTQTGGVEPGEDGVEVGTLAAGESRELTATFQATDDAEVEFSAMATAALADGRSEIGVGRSRWSVRPEHLVGLDTTVVRPAEGELLPAGDTIRVRGTVKNLSNTATLELGPLYPTSAGNAGVMSLTYDATGADPRDLQAADPLVLEPGESREFTVRVLTAWSDPRRIDGDHRHGGTWAELTFTPWGRATLEDGTVVEIEAEQVLAEESDLRHRVSIDDSIEIPAFDPLAFGGAVLVGGVEGVWNATVATLWGVVELAKLPYTTVVATAEFQSQVWGSFTEEEREAFAADSALLARSVLMRNAELGREGAAALYERVKAATYQYMEEMENEWRVGDYTATARLYSRYGTDAIAQVAVPTALAKMARSPRAVAALARAQEAINTRMASLLGRTTTITRVEEIRPVLNALESGVELLPAQLEVLYGITPEELGELQKLADKYDFLLTVRSRHESSIEWIERFDAMLKPEKIKIKSVSELDTKLGYRASDLGSLVFRKPEPLRRFQAGEGDFGALLDEFVTSKGFEAGTSEWTGAVNRVMARVKEWQKWEKTYKKWSDQGWLDVSFNYKGNGVYDPIRTQPSKLGVAPLESGKFVGFRLRSIGEEDFVIEMFNAKKGKWAPVTGDIDPIAFTHLDGSPLTMAEHADLLDDLRNNPLLQSQHPESTTFVSAAEVGGGDGRDFIISQFKPNEPGLQIAPGGHLPRVVRINKDKSRWVNERDYHIHFDGGFVYSGTYLNRSSQPLPTFAVPPAELPPAAKARPIPKAVSAEPNVGRCLVSYSTDAAAVPLIIDGDGRIVEVLEDGGTRVSPLDEQCFAEGEVLAVSAMPVTGVAEAAQAGDTEVEIPGDEAEQYLASQAGGELQVGQEVTIGAGTDHADTYTVTGFGSIVLDRPLERPYEAGDLIVVTAAAPVAPGSTTTTTVSGGSGSSTTTVPGADPADGSSAAGVAGAGAGGSGSGATGGTGSTGTGSTGTGSTGTGSTGTGSTGSGDRSGASLALTGRQVGEPLLVGLGFVVLGLLFVAGARADRESLDRRRGVSPRAPLR